MNYRIFSLLFLIFGLVACDAESINAGLPVPNAPARQLDATQLALGKQVFQDSCASCHGVQAEGAVNWRKKDADGFYPAPPLNGSGHGWHHSCLVPVYLATTRVRCLVRDATTRPLTWNIF